MSDHRISVYVHGPEILNERGFPNRTTLASCDVPVSPDVAWRIYQDAVAAAVRPSVEILTEGQPPFPEPQMEEVG